MAADDVELVRAPVLRAIRSKDALALVGPDGTIRKLTGSSAELANAVLEHCTGAPRSRADIIAHVELLAGAPLDDPTVIDQLLRLLRESGALRPGSQIALPPETGRTAGTRALLCITGAVAAAHAPQLVQALQARGFEVQVVASPNALRLVAREALEALTHEPVFRSMWQRDGGVRVPHIELAAWPDVVLVWPATAKTLSRIAAGDCSGLVPALAITTRAPVLLAPSMNEAMYSSPSVQRNLETLEEDGFYLLPPAFAHEVADAPGERRAAPGGAPGPVDAASLLEALSRLAASADRVLPRNARAWEALHRRTPESEQPWFTPEVDPQIAEAVRAHGAPPALLWDVGTGHGATATWAATEGFQVIATDVSSTALERARLRAGSAPITFLEDDVTRSALGLCFDVVVDRGTLHTLPPEERPAYVSRIVACTRPGSVVILEVHAPPADPRLCSHPMTVEEVVELFGPSMELVESAAGTFAGTLDPPPPSILCVLRRRHTPDRAGG